MSRNAVDQKAQWGAESTPGTAVSATNVFTGLEVEVSPKIETGSVSTQGKRFGSKIYKKKEWSEGKLKGTADFNGQTEILEWVFGSKTVGTPADGVTARTYALGSAKTRTLAYGDAGHASRVAGAFVTSASWKWGRNSGSTEFECDFTGGLWEDGVSLPTASAEYAIEPIEAGMVDVFADSTHNDLGTTPLPSVLSVEVKLDDIRTDDWRLNSSKASIAGSVETVVKGEISLLIECDADGRAFLDGLRNGEVLYVRVSGTGAEIGTGDDVQEFQLDACVQVQDYETGSDDDLYTSKVTLGIIQDAAGHNVAARTVTDI